MDYLFNVERIAMSAVQVIASQRKKAKAADMKYRFLPQVVDF